MIASRLLLALMCLALAVAGRAPAMAKGPDDVFNALLGRYVVTNADGVNRVDYARWKASDADRAKLSGYLTELQARTPSRMKRDEAVAYWSNLYNAVTLKVVLERFPVSSIRDIKSDSLFDPKAYIGPWRTKRVTVEGTRYSLDDIEHNILRPMTKDPRVHYAVNCASLGCPNLRAKAWTAATLERELDTAARAFVNHPRAVTVLPGNKLRVSSIYKWFAEDFGGSDAGIIAHLRKFAEPRLAAALVPGVTIAENFYDWSINDIANAGE
jgi:hypothetical protein